MPKDEWGVKRLCPTCATKFYDLTKDPMTCPSCGASFDLASLISGKPKAASPAKSKEKAKAAEDDDLEVDTAVLEDDGDDIDDELLDDDDDDDTVSLDEIEVSKDDD